METRTPKNPGRFQIVKLEDRIAPTSCLTGCLPCVSLPSISLDVDASVSTCPISATVGVSLSVGDCS